MARPRRGRRFLAPGANPGFSAANNKHKFRLLNGFLFCPELTTGCRPAVTTYHPSETAAPSQELDLSRHHWHVSTRFSYDHQQAVPYGWQPAVPSASPQAIATTCYRATARRNIGNPPNTTACFLPLAEKSSACCLPLGICRKQHPPPLAEAGCLPLKLTAAEEACGRNVDE